jgi:hypothetical protein
MYHYFNFTTRPVPSWLVHHEKQANQKATQDSLGGSSTLLMARVAEGTLRLRPQKRNK